MFNIYLKLNKSSNHIMNVSFDDGKYAGDIGLIKLLEVAHKDTVGTYISGANYFCEEGILNDGLGLLMYCHDRFHIVDVTGNYPTLPEETYNNDKIVE